MNINHRLAATNAEQRTPMRRNWIWLSLFGALLLATVIVYAMAADTTIKATLTLLTLLVLFTGLIVVLGDRWIKYTLVLPSVVVMFAVTVVPLAFLIVMSVTNVKLSNFNKTWDFVGLQNFIYFFTKDRLFFPTLVRTFEYTAFALITQIIVGIALALLLQKPFKMRNLVSSFLVIPVMTCPIVIAMLWKSMMNSQTGIINNIMISLGGTGVNWLTNEPLSWIQSIPVIGEWIVKNLNANIGFLSLLLVNTWQWTPFVFLMILSGLNSMSKEPFEAAVVDGANGWQTFWNVTFPLLKPVMSVVILMRLIDLMKVYDQIYTMFGDNITMRTLNIHIFSIGLTNQDYGRGSALSIIVLVFIILITKMFMAFNNRIGEKRGVR